MGWLFITTSWGCSLTGRILRLHLDQFETENDDEDSLDSSLRVADTLVRLLDGMSSMQHLYLSTTARETAVLAMVVGQLVPPTPPASPHSGKYGLLKRMRSFALDCSQERHNTKPIFAAVEPLLASSSYLDFLLVRSYNEVERTRSRPRILPFLAHVTAPLRTLHLGGCWQERDDDLLALLPPRLRTLSELFFLHGCDHNNHGQWVRLSKCPVANARRGRTPLRASSLSRICRWWSGRSRRSGRPSRPSSARTRRSTMFGSSRARWINSQLWASRAIRIITSTTCLASTATTWVVMTRRRPTPPPWPSFPSSGAVPRRSTTSLRLLLHVFANCLSCGMIITGAFRCCTFRVSLLVMYTSACLCGRVWVRPLGDGSCQ